MYLVNLNTAGISINSVYNPDLTLQLQSDASVRIQREYDLIRYNAGNRHDVSVNRSTLSVFKSLVKLNTTGISVNSVCNPDI
jgi:hypothetical protein